MAEAAGLYSHSLGDGDEKDVVIAKVKLTNQDALWTGNCVLISAVS